MCCVSIICKGVDADAAAGGEDTGYLKVLRIHQLHKVLHDDVHAVFVEIPVVAERKEIEFQRLRLHHFLPRDVGDVNRGKVGLTGLRAQRSELRTTESNQILVIRMFVYEGLKHFGSVIGWIRSVAIPQ